MKDFTHTEKRIIEALYKLSRPATINEIAKWADKMSWNTASETLNNLSKQNIVVYTKFGERKYWILNI